MNQEELYSYHVFLFPFQWYYTGEKFKNKTIEEKNNLKLFTEFLRKGNWRDNKLKLDTKLGYNEYNYFYDFVRDIMYETEENSPEFSPGRHHEAFVKHFEYDVKPEELSYSFTAPIRGGEKRYELKVDSIILHLYNTGIGVLSFHLNNRNPNQKEPDDILCINQFGRRISPPFLSVDYNVIGTQAQFRPGDFDTGLDTCQRAEMPKMPGLGIGPDETFDYYRTTRDFSKGVFRLPQYMKDLFQSVPVVTDISEVESEKIDVFLSPVLDDRMFVVCWYGNNELVNQIREYDQNTDDFLTIVKDKERGFDYKWNSWLYKFVFVDAASLTCRNTDMRIKAMDNHLNVRWSDYGTIFGATRYSLVCLTQPLTDEGFRKFGAPFIVNHVQTMYYKMAELCLVQRACILRFSDEVAEISAMKESQRKYLPDKVASLYKQYIRFVNRIYFREITAQDQGIELYDLLQKHMRLSDHVKDLDREIEELHNYLRMEEQADQNRELTNLTRLAAIFLPATLVVGALGMNDLYGDIMGIKLEEHQQYKALVLNILLTILGFIFGLTIAFWKNLSKLGRKILKP